MSSPLPSPYGFCYRCGRTLSPEAQFCPTCGTPRLGAGAPFAPVGSGYAPGGGAPPSPKQGLSALGIIGIVVIVVVAVIVVSGLIAWLLYFEVSSVTRGPISTPLGAAFAFGRPQPTNCTSAWVAGKICVTPSDFAYQVPVSASTISLDNVAFFVETYGGAVFRNVGVAEIAVLSNIGQVVAFAVITPGAGIAMTAGWTNYSSGVGPSTPLYYTDSIVIDMGQVTSTVGQSLILQAIGLNGYSGTLSNGLP